MNYHPEVGDLVAYHYNGAGSPVFGRVTRVTFPLYCDVDFVTGNVIGSVFRSIHYYDVMPAHWTFHGPVLAKPLNRR